MTHIWIGKTSSLCLGHKVQKSSKNWAIQYVKYSQIANSANSNGIEKCKKSVYYFKQQGKGDT